MNRALLLVGAISLLSLSACGDDAPKDKDEGPSCDRRSPVAGLALEDVLARGAFPVGEQQVTLVRDGSCFGEEGNEPRSRELRTRLFYPATEAGTDGPPLAEGGPFPLAAAEVATQLVPRAFIQSGADAPCVMQRAPFVEVAEQQ